MGLNLKSLKYFEEITDVLGYKNFKNLRMCQLGDSKIRQCARRYLYRRHNKKRYLKADEYFEDIGFEIITIDLGVGSESISDRVLRYDLSTPFDEEIGTFDFVLDFGTGEHVENQFELFRNIHRLCRINGVIIRINPSNRFGEGHGHGYSFGFYIRLSKLCGYKVIDVREMYGAYGIKNLPHYRNNLYATMLKKRDVDFSLNEFSIVEQEITRKKSFPRKAKDRR